MLRNVEQVVQDPALVATTVMSACGLTDDAIGRQQFAVAEALSYCSARTARAGLLARPFTADPIESGDRPANGARTLIKSSWL
jgi:hypothetical protein